MMMMIDDDDDDDEFNWICQINPKDEEMSLCLSPSSFLSLSEKLQMPTNKSIATIEKLEVLNVRNHK